MGKILALVAIAALSAGCNDVQAPLLNASEVASFNRGILNAPFIATALAAAERHTCAFAVGGDLQCWGRNTNGQIGVGTTGGTFETPTRVSSAFVQVSVGGGHTCALNSAGAAYCWGANRTGALGTGTLDASSVPLPVDTELRFATIGTGNTITCALTGEGAAYCWGNNQVGALGTETTELCSFGLGTVPCSTRPVPVTGGHTFAVLHVGLFDACGLTDAGAAWCWGNNRYGQLGVGTFGRERNPTPTAVSGGIVFSQLSVGAAHMCGIASSGTAYCWGYNVYGQLGTGAVSARATTPSPVAGNPNFTAIVASDGNTIFGHSCGTEADGTMFCWGNNSAGQLGTAEVLPTCGTTGIFAQPCSVTPLRVQTAMQFSAFDLGNEYSCAISSPRRAYCWGTNVEGSLGNPDVATNTSSVTPVAGGTRGRAPSQRPEPQNSFRISDH